MSGILQTSIVSELDRFSLDSYRRVLSAAMRRGGRFRQFTEGELAGGETIVLRHDIDFSLSAALELAEVNASLGIRGTFFVLLRSQIYNALSGVSRGVVLEIAARGQDIGLHATPADEKWLTEERCEKWLARDFEILANEFAGVVPAFAWHNPSDALIAASRSRSAIAGLANAYANKWIGEGCYVSDSNLRYRPAELETIVGVPRRKPLQVLLHPINWVSGARTMDEVLAAAWRRVIRERERGLGENQIYREVLPAGMPESLLESFADGWLDAARREK